MKIKRFLKISSEIPVASMSDIAFLLIVFFMIAAVFAAEAGFLLKLPAKDSAPIKVPGEALIEVQIKQDNTIWLNNKLTTLSAINLWLQQRPGSQKNYVMLKADDKSKFETMVLLIERFKNYGYEKISIKRLGE